MTSNEALVIWAQRKLDDRGISYSDSDLISVVEEEFSDGYCETCYYSWTGLAIKVNGGTEIETSGTMSDILEELFAIVSEGKA